MINKSQDAIYDTLSNTGDLCREWWAYGRSDAFNQLVNRLIGKHHYGAGEVVIEDAVKEVITYWRDNATDYVIGGSYDGTPTEFVAQVEPDGGSLVLTSDLASAVRMPLETARSFILDNGLNRFSIFIHHAGGVRMVTDADMV
jgi:hypothetical protein